MRAIRILLVMFAICFFVEAYSQSSRKTNHSRSRLGYKTPKVKRKKAQTICPVFETSQFPYHALGFKLGDPFALTYKYYPNKKIAFVADLGKPSSGLYNRYYIEKFIEGQNASDDTLSGNAMVTYTFHRVTFDLIGELKLLYNFDVRQIFPGLQAYVGAGWQWRRSNIKYEYFYNENPQLGDLNNDFRSITLGRSTMGPQGVFGIEYANFQLPFSAFMEIEYFIDLQSDPGWRRVEGGVGIRSIF
jgi:hypothetical protein